MSNSLTRRRFIESLSGTALLPFERFGRHEFDPATLPVTLTLYGIGLLLINQITTTDPPTARIQIKPLIPLVKVAEQADVDRLAGLWRATESTSGRSGECLFVFHEGTVEFRGAPSHAWYRGPMTIDSNAKPKRLTCDIEESGFPPFVGKPGLAIFRFDGDTLIVTGNPPGNPHLPETFNQRGSRRLVLKRSGPVLTENALRQLASEAAHKHLIRTQKLSSGVAITDEHGQRIVPGPIPPETWSQKKTPGGHQFERHVTQNIFQVVHCDADGKNLDVSYSVKY